MSRPSTVEAKKNMAAGKVVAPVEVPAGGAVRTWSPLTTALSAAPVVAALAWAYADSFQKLVQLWIAEPDYNHGFLVPLFSVYLLWHRRKLINRPALRGSWWGAVLLVMAAAMRWISAYFFYPTLDVPSLIPCLAGIVLLVGGWTALSWSWPSLVFLVFMMPLPAGIAGLFSHRLQRIATLCSTWLLQLFGVPAVSYGNVIRLSNGELGIVEACSGLRMLMLFLAISVGASFLIDRPLWEKTFVAASALFIGVITNVIRITATALLFEYVGEELAHRVFHDLAGWLMMPLAMLFMGVEIWLLSKILISPQQSPPMVVSR
jgi:exosortase